MRRLLLSARAPLRLPASGLRCLAAVAALCSGLLAGAPVHATAVGDAEARVAGKAPPLFGRREFRPTRVRTYRAWSGMPERRFRVTEPVFAERIASMERRSAFVRARLEAIRRSGMRVWVMTPEALQVFVPGSATLRAGWATLLNGGRDAVAVIDLRWLRERVASGEVTEEQMLADLDLLIGHELFIHIGSIGPGRDTRSMCADPEPVPGAVGCSVVEENLFTFSLDPSRPFRPDYRHSPLRADRIGGELTVVPEYTSFFYPELESRGWEDTPYHLFLRANTDVRAGTPFQREIRELWERGLRERADSLYTRFMDAVRDRGTHQDTVETALLAEMAAPYAPTPEDRFRMRELEFVRVGKHERARQMTQRRLFWMTRRRLPMRQASARVVREFASVPLAPESFHEAVEAMYRRGEWERVRQVYASYLRALAAGQAESAVRESLALAH